jgi:hypothetical protein
MSHRGNVMRFWGILKPVQGETIMQTTFDTHDQALVSPHALWQSLFACVAMLAVLVVGIYYGLTYDAPPQTPEIASFEAEENGNSLNFAWNVDHINLKTITITLERHLGNNQWVNVVINRPLTAEDELSIATPHEMTTYRLALRDTDGNLVQQRLVQVQ